MDAAIFVAFAIVASGTLIYSYLTSQERKQNQ